MEEREKKKKRKKQRKKINRNEDRAGARDKTLEKGQETAEPPQSQIFICLSDINRMEREKRGHNPYYLI